MPPFLKPFLHRLAALDRWYKRAIVMAMDFCILGFALWAGFAARLNDFYVPPTLQFTGVLAVAPAIGVLVFWRIGIYRLVTRYPDARALRKILVAVTIAVLLWSLLFLAFRVEGILPRSTIILYGIFAFGLVWLSRTLISWIVVALIADQDAAAAGASATKGVLIYGAGPVGVQLLDELRHNQGYRPVAFLDPSPALAAQKINGIKIYPPGDIAKVLARGGISEIHIAEPRLTRTEKRGLMQTYEALGLIVRDLPSLEDIASGRVSVSDLRDVDVTELLVRPPVAVDTRLRDQAVAGKSILVTGAGGSIGSELCRQIAFIGPRVLVLFEVSEAALYLIERELRELALETVADNVAPRIVGILGSVGDAEAVRQVIRQYGIDTIFHAAAYKHVPIVEANPAAGIRNNTFGTMVVARAARDLGVARMVLISTDKAVRPTNIMGASKRLAELVLQAAAADPDCGTVFTMVRFGNVLDSSGSVVRLFREQIRQGGPVTVTHKDITRYFMSIPEAAELVIQAGAMATGGEVFVLDMGAPVRIDDLARRMITLMGRTVRDEAHPDGDVAIVYSGLRPGEKLYEELLIGANTMETAHPRIRKSLEPFLPEPELARELGSIAYAIDAGEVDLIHAALKRTVEGYVPDLRAVHLVATEVSETLH